MNLWGYNAIRNIEKEIEEARKRKQMANLKNNPQEASYLAGKIDGLARALDFIREAQ